MRNEAKWYLRTQDETFGPETEARLVEWAKLGRIQPGQEVSDDNEVWRRVEDVPFLDLRFSIDLGDGNPRGPFNRAAAEALLASGRLPPSATLVETRAPFEDAGAVGADVPTVEPDEPTISDPEPNAEPEPNAAPAEPTDAQSESATEEPQQVEAPEPTAEEPTNVPTAATEPEVRVVEKIVEVPVEKIVEKEVRVEVPVEKIVEVEKVVVDETRVKELEGLLAEERRHTGDLQTRLDAAAKSAAELRAQVEASSSEVARVTKEAEGAATEAARAAKDAADREAKLRDQVHALEDELRRLPQAASEVADIQAAVYAIMTGEAEELGRILEAEKREFEAFKQRHLERADHLLERRREMLKRAGANIEDMTRKALRDRPEDPRTTQLRKELDDLRRTHEMERLESESKVRELTTQLRERKAEEARLAENMKDVTQLRAEVEALREQLQTREKELVAERQHTEDIRRQQATRQQVLLNRLATLESPSIGTAQSMETNQSREAKLVRLPSWMRFKK